MLLLLSLNVSNVLSAGNAPKPTKTSTPTRTPTATITPTRTPTSTFTNTPITHTPTFTATPGPALQLVALVPNLEAGLYSSYTLDSIPGIGIDTNDIYIFMSVSGVTTNDGDFSRGTFYPTIRNNRNTTLNFYWSAIHEEIGGINETLRNGFGSDFWEFQLSEGYNTHGHKLRFPPSK
jgi:hypothetical protein